ncbi:MAG TPA: hypothetical protein VEB22_05385 [Phycisphaerales bacterium]|nr:hypothetical protein [Phycisphaerales bacterium]
MRYPTKISEFVPWVLARATVWKATPAAVGLSVAQATAVDNAAKALQIAFDEANKQRQLSKNATVAQTEALRAAMTQLQLDLRIIDAFANASTNPAAVYTAAEISPPAVPTPVAPPGAVSEVTVGIDINTGATVLKWKGNNPGGSSNVSYILRRKLAGQSEFAFIGTAGSSGPEARTFTDSTLPQGVDSVAYLITATRGSTTGPSVQVQVRFGTIGSPGQAGISSVKMAA